MPDAKPSESLQARGAPAEHPRPPTPSRFPAIAEDKATVSAAADTHLPVLPAASDLLESARATARSLAREQESGRAMGGKLGERPFLPALDRALGKHTAGETLLANGLVKVTTTSGTSYCLQPPPESARGGPVPMLAVPTNCP